ncbi:MAG TPA: Hsp70 family protein [Acidimicrobiia bacterium]|nr:Hsp70 family protein [Acidimicrobiia bacterium]
MSERRDALGVDLGTTWTAAARCAPGGEAEALALGESGPAMPSVVAVEGDTVLAGDAAERRLLAEPSSGAREPKRRLGDTTPFVIGGTPYGADTLMGHLLRHVLAVAAGGDGGQPEQVVLTHPANWGEFKLDLLREAGRVAGVGDVTLLSEPEAAALHYLHLGRVHPGDAVAVYDFGGGTFDVAVVRCGDGTSEVLGSPQGLERLGGLDLDDAVLAHVNASLDGHLAEIDPTDPAVRRALVQLRVQCTRAKEALSLDSETAIPIALPDLVTEVRITRGEFESAIRPRLEDTLGAFDRALASAGLQAGDLAGVLLVGGSSRIPVVSELVAQHTGRPVLVDADAKLVVALGAAGFMSTTTSESVKETAMAETTPPEASKEEAAEAKGETKPGDGKGDAAKRPAAKSGGGGGGGTRTIAGREVNLGRVAAGAAGVAAVGAAAAGVVASGLLDDDASASTTTAPHHEQQQHEEPGHHHGESMDAFDSPGSGPGAAATAFTSAPHHGGGGGGAVHHGGGEPAHHAGGAEPVHHAGGAEGGMGAGGMGATGGIGGGTLTAPDIDSARAELHDRLEHWTPPAGADAADVDKLRTELNHLIDNYQPVPGQSVESAIANLQDQFQDRVHDFTQDQKIDALVAEEQRDNAQSTLGNITTGTTPGMPETPGGAPGTPGMPGTSDPTQPASGTGMPGTTTTGMPGTATGMPGTTAAGMPGTTAPAGPATGPAAGPTGMGTAGSETPTGAPTPTDPLPDLTHDPNMDPATPAYADATADTATATGQADPTTGIHFDHEPANTGIVPPDLMTAPGPEAQAAASGLVDEFDAVAASPDSMAAGDTLGIIADPARGSTAPDLTAAATMAPGAMTAEAAAPDAMPSPAPMFEDDLLGTHAMAQATAEAAPMPAFEHAAPEVTMTAPDLTPTAGADEPPAHADLAPAHEVMAAPEPPPEEHHDFAPVDDAPHVDDAHDQD